MFANNVSKENSWMVCSGSVDQVPGHEQVSRLSLEKVMQHEFVGTTKDGGLALCLADFEGRSAPLFLQDSNGPTMPTAAGPPLSRSERAKPPYSNSGVAAPEGEPGMHTNQLSASCYCGGVAFQVTRPNSASTACSSPFPDLLVPYHSSSSENPTDVKWWLRANKYLAGTCACRSCRLGSGSPIQAWAFIPKANISQRDGSPIDYGIGTLQEIESSKDCFRNFCGTCGATVFWHSRTRPDLVDVSVGLLRAEEGSRAENWLQWWTERVSFQEDALDAVLIDNLQRGLGRIHSNGQGIAWP
ncbi:hypothetical protein ABEF95_013295 [Exophiala dermatitidis]